MELSTRKTLKRVIEPVDEWLQNEGFYRKHAPKDPTCLFRAVSEQVYHSQRNHITVRNECIEFMKKNRQMFEEKISTPYDSYLSQMACFTEWGGMNEILAMSLLYQRNVVIFHGQKLTKDAVIDHGFEKTINLCFTPPKQYETVYTSEHTADAGFCQSLVYQTLYKNVFKMTNVDVTVHKMLHERTTNNLRHDKFFLKGNIDMRNQLTMELLHKLDENNENDEDSEEAQLLSKGITPFPYRVAKALDPNIYRNVDYDIWHEIRKEVRNSGYTKFYSNELQNGSKCTVQVDYEENDRANNNFLIGKENWDSNKAPPKGKRLRPGTYTGHIQEMSKNEGPVVVFIEEVGERMTVPYGCLKAYSPRNKIRPNSFTTCPNKNKNIIPSNPKWKKSYNNQTRRIREMTPTDNGAERNEMDNPKPVAKNNALNQPDWSVDSNSENQQVKKQNETYQPYKEYNANNASVDNGQVVLENTHVTPVEVVERAMASEQAKNKPHTANSDVHRSQSKKQPPVSHNHEIKQPNKQHNQRAEKNEAFHPYQNAIFINPHFPNDSEYVNYDVTKVVPENGEVPHQEPIPVRRVYNMCYLTPPIYAPNAVNGPAFGESYCYIPHSPQPPPDVTMGTTMMNGPMPANEQMIQVNSPNQPNIPNNHNNNHNNNNNNSNGRHNFRSTTPRPENQNGPRHNGQKPNYRQQQTQYQPHNIDYNRNRFDHKNFHVNDQQQQQQHIQNKDNVQQQQHMQNKDNMQQQHLQNKDHMQQQQYFQSNDHMQQQQHFPNKDNMQQQQQNKDMQRGNKNNSAPRFKKNYDGRNRGEHQYQYNPDFRYNKNNNRQQQQNQVQQQQLQLQPLIENTHEMNEAMQMQQQQTQPPPPPPPTSVMQPQQQQQQTQTPPPPLPPQPQINGNYPYPLYNQQVSYVPIAPYPIDADGFTGHFYPAPPANFIPLQYLTPPELTEGSPGGPPLYSPIETFPAQYPIYPPPQFIPYQFSPAIYPSPPPSSAPGGIPEGCYPAPPFPGPPYFLPYPPPPIPANLIPSPQNSPAH